MQYLVKTNRDITIVLCRDFKLQSVWDAHHTIGKCMQSIAAENHTIIYQQLAQ
jgi:hypothetical protein